jgi:hypothetical protein
MLITLEAMLGRSGSRRVGRVVARGVQQEGHLVLRLLSFRGLGWRQRYDALAV